MRYELVYVFIQKNMHHVRLRRSAYFFMKGFTEVRTNSKASDRMQILQTILCLETIALPESGLVDNFCAGCLYGGRRDIFCFIEQEGVERCHV